MKNENKKERLETPAGNERFGVMATEARKNGSAKVSINSKSGKILNTQFRKYDKQIKKVE